MGQEAVQQDLGATTASCPLSALPRAGGDVGGARPWSSENGESRARVFLTGISVVGRKEFHFPVLQGRGGVQGSSVHHRTINRTSTTSKMTKRTMIAHHCRRSGRERNGRSSYFNRRKAEGELFLTTLPSLCFPSKGKLPHQQNKHRALLQAPPYCLWGDSASLPGCSCFLGLPCGILRFLPSQVQTDLISWFKSDQEEAESCSVLLLVD